MRRLLTKLFAASTILAGAASAQAQIVKGPVPIDPIPIKLCVPDINKSAGPYNMDGSTSLAGLPVTGGLGATFNFNAGCGQIQASATGDVHVGMGSITAKPFELVLSATTKSDGNHLDAKFVAFGHTLWMDGTSTTDPISGAHSYGYTLPADSFLDGSYSFSPDWLPASASISYNTVASIAVAPIYNISPKQVSLSLISSAALSASVHGELSATIEGFSATAKGDGVIEILRYTQGGHATLKDRRRFPGDPIINPYSADAANSLAVTDTAGGYLTISADIPGYGTWSKRLFNETPYSYYPADFSFVWPQQIVVKGY